MAVVLILCSKFTKNRLLIRLCPDPLGELTVLPRPHSWIMEEWRGNGDGRVGGEERGGEREGGEGRGKGEGRVSLERKSWLYVPELSRLVQATVFTEHLCYR